MDKLALQSVSVELRELKLEVENLANHLENVCERLDTQYASVSQALIAIMSKTGAKPPSKIFSEPIFPEDDVLYERARRRRKDWQGIDLLPAEAVWHRIFPCCIPSRSSRRAWCDRTAQWNKIASRHN